MNCAAPNCRASVFWLGHPTDAALATYAKSLGWKLFESQGWLCPHHTKVQP